MKILTYNVNGIRAALRKDFSSWLKAVNPDIICLQEIKANPEQFDESIFIEKNTFVFPLKDLENRYHNAFYFGGNLVDVDISTDKMKKFLAENESDLMLLANEYMKKINLGTE